MSGVHPPDISGATSVHSGPQTVWPLHLKAPLLLHAHGKIKLLGESAHIRSTWTTLATGAASCANLECLHLEDNR
jgi:hypothetical protein